MEAYVYVRCTSSSIVLDRGITTPKALSLFTFLVDLLTCGPVSCKPERKGVFTYKATPRAFTAFTAAYCQNVPKLYKIGGREERDTSTPGAILSFETRVSISHNRLKMGYSTPILQGPILAKFWFAL
jgi:hypothetical protein